MGIRKRLGIGGAATVALSAVMGGIGHLAGLFDNAGAGVSHPPVGHPPPVEVPAPHWPPPKVPHVPVPEGGAVITDTAKVAIEQGVTTFKELRKGVDSDQALIKAACAAMDQYLSQTPSYEEMHKAIDGKLPAALGPGSVPYRYLGPKVNKVSNVVAVTSLQNVRVSYYYWRYCLTA